MSLIVTGTIGIDTIYTPAGHAAEVLGGSCTYFAAAASFYGKVRLVAVVGDDFPREYLEVLARFRNIDAAGLEVRKGSKTFRWGGRYHENMDHRDTLFTELGVLTEPPPVVPAQFRDSQIVFLANTHPAVQLQLLSNFHKPQLVVADTMDLWINTARSDLDQLLHKVHGLVLNYDEAELLTGKHNTVAAARQIVRRGPEFVVVKKGEHGCVFVHREGMGALPAYPNENVVDPTGAGDAFAGGMMAYLASQMGKTDDLTDPELLRRALAHGTVIASFNIEAFSLEALQKLTRDELALRYDEYGRMLRVH
jgi:sugar/nucleoside kinase (ribokinase family)